MEWILTPKVQTSTVNSRISVSMVPDTWKGTTRISHMLYIFHHRCLLTILGISWRDHVTNDELMKRAGMENLSDIVRVRRLTLAGHILRLPSDRPQVRLRSVQSAKLYTIDTVRYNR